MKVKILGNGGAVNDGLPYNAFIIDDDILIEAPPDIMLSLAREGISPKNIKEIYISHLHGDHCFGFPFIALRVYFEQMISKQSYKIKIFAPGRAREYLLDLAGKAVSEKHPLISWIEQNIIFINISDSSEIDLGKYKARLYKMDHYEETYGFIIKNKNENIFAYISDTKWSQNVIDVLEENPKNIILDLNGEIDDPVRVHLAENDIIENGFGLVSLETKFYGTHLRYQKRSKSGRIVYVKPGMELEFK